jgi:DNA-binding SARP family transcriptional activator
MTGGFAMDTHHAGRLVRGAAHPGCPVVHLFGGPYVTEGGQRREVPEGSKQLLAFIAVRRRRVERRQAAGTLWPVGDEGRAAGNLRSALWRLRRAGIDLVVADKCALRLSAETLVDLHVMDQWATRLIDGTASGPDLALPPFLADALDLLPGWYDDWALMERERIRQRILHALEALSAQLADTGRFADAVEAAMLAISAEPLRETAQRALIHAHLAEGNLAEAHRSYRAYRKLIRHELGIEPSPNLTTALSIPQIPPPAARPGRLPPARQPSSSASGPHNR